MHFGLVSTGISERRLLTSEWMLLQRVYGRVMRVSKRMIHAGLGRIGLLSTLHITSKLAK